MDLAMIILLAVDGLLLIGVILGACFGKKNNTASKDNVIYVKEIGKIIIDESDKVYAVVKPEPKVEETAEEKVEKVEPTIAVTEEVEEPTEAVAEEVEEPTEAVAEEVEEPTEAVAEEVEEPTEAVAEEVEEPTEAVAEEVEEPTEAVAEEVEEPTEAVAEEVEEPTELGIFSFAKDNKPTLPFSDKLINSDDRIKLYYNEIRNQFKSYKGINARLSKRYDTFRKGRELIAKITFAGKTMKIYLKMNPSSYDTAVYHHKDASDKKSYKEVPMMLRVKSDRTYKHVINLIDELMLNEGVEPKKKYEDVNYIDYVKTLQNME